MEFMTNDYDDLIRDLFNEEGEVLDEFGMEREAERIAHESYPGFMPYTNGGWSLMVMNTLGSIWGSGERFNEKAQGELDRAIDYSLEMALESFIEDSMDDMKRVYGTDDKEKLKEIVSYHDLYDRDESTLAEQLSEYENESMSEGSEFWLVLRASYFKADNSHNESGEDEIFFYGGINTDFSYGRDSGLITTFERTVKVSDLGAGNLVDVAEVITEMVNSLNDQ